MNQFKIPLLIVLLICFLVTFLFAWFYFAPNLLVKPPEVTNQPPINEKPTPDARLSNTLRDSKLESETDALLTFFDNMPKVPIYLKDEPILKKGNETETGVATTFCDNNVSPFIIIKKVYYKKANRIQLKNTLKHELTHAWLCRQNLMSVGHNEVFRKKFTQVGGLGN